MNSEPLHALCQAIQGLMLARGLTLSCAESCTGGGVAAALTSVDGSSGYFQGGLVAYQNELKERFLGVSEADIRQFDVVSRPVVEQMVKGACALFHTDCALATTGYAGEGNGRIASGTIWIAWGTAAQVRSLCLVADEGREANTAHAVRQVLQHFRLWLEAKEGQSAAR